MKSAANPASGTMEEIERRSVATTSPARISVVRSRRKYRTARGAVRSLPHSAQIDASLPG